MKPGARWDMVLADWEEDYPDPSSFLNELFDPRPLPGVFWGGGTTISHYRDRHYLARLRATYLVGGAARGTAYGRLDTEMFRQSPPAAVYATVRGTPQIFSSRIGCQVFRPQDNGLVDLAALCIRGAK